MFLFSFFQNICYSTMDPSSAPGSIWQQPPCAWSHRSLFLDNVCNWHSEKTIALPRSVQHSDASDGELCCTEAPFCNSDRGRGDTSCNPSLHTEGTSLSRI